MNPEERNHAYIDRHHNCSICGGTKSLILICSNCFSTKQRISEARTKWFGEEQQPQPGPDIPRPYDPLDDEEPEEIIKEKM